MLPDAGSMAGGFFATSISGKMPAGIEASFTRPVHLSSKYAMLTEGHNYYAESPAT